MSEQWYCPNCGPDASSQVYKDCATCHSCDRLCVHQPDWLIAMQKCIALLEEDKVKLQRVAIQTVFYLRESLEVNDGYELDEALRAAGYLGEGNG